MVVRSHKMLSDKGIHEMMMKMARHESSWLAELAGLPRTSPTQARASVICNNHEANRVVFIFDQLSQVTNA